VRGSCGVTKGLPGIPPSVWDCVPYFIGFKTDPNRRERILREWRIVNNVVIPAANAAVWQPGFGWKDFVHLVGAIGVIDRAVRYFWRIRRYTTGQSFQNAYPKGSKITRIVSSKALEAPKTNTKGSYRSKKSGSSGRSSFRR